MSQEPISSLATDPAPFDEAEVLSPEWLTSVLEQRFPGIRVTGVEVTEHLQTMATKVRFRLTYAEPVQGAPPAMCVKGYFNPDTRGSVSTSLTETSFYREIAPTLDMCLPVCIYSGNDPETGHGLILMEDLVEQGARFLTARSPYSIDQVHESLDQIARLNAARWGDPALAEIAYLTPRIEMMTRHVTLERLQEHLDGPRADGLPAELRDAARVEAAVLAVYAQAADYPRCLVHGDTHAGNLFVAPDGQVGVIDWQILQAGWWALDVAYHIAAVLETSVRERSERDLLAHYLERLAAHGAPAPAWDDAWLQYRTAIAYGYYLWAITKMVDPDIIVLFNQRLGAAAAYHGSYALLGV